jgi:uncharacterized membrane protein
MPMPVLPRGEPSEAVSIALVVAAVGLLFLPLSFITYALYDDYAYMAIHAYRGQNPFFMGDGRPIGGAIAVALFSIFDRVELGGWLRLIALVELLAALVLLHRAAIVSGLRPLWAGAFAIGVATMPSMQNWVVWGVSAWELPALVLSIGSFFAWRGFSGAGQPHQRRAVVLFVLMSLVSLLIYQPFATAVWPLIFIDIVLRRDVKTNLRPLVVAVVSYVLAIIVFYAMFKGMAAAFVPDAGHNRTKLIAIADLPERVRTFLAFPVAAALSPFRTHPHLGLAAAMLALILAGLYRVAPRRLDLAGNIVFLLAAAVVAHSPSLLSSEPTGLRTNVVISLLALGALCLALQSLLAGGRVLAPLVAALLFAAILRAAYIMITVTAVPQAIELAAIGRRLTETRLPDSGTLLLIGVPYGTSLVNSDCDRYAAIGCASSTYQWALPNMVRLWMREHGVDPARYLILFAQVPGTANAVSFEADWTTVVPVPADAMTIDFGRDLLAIAASNRRAGKAR